MKKNAHIIAAIVSGFFAFLATNSATFGVAMVATAGVLFFELRHKATWVMPTLGLVALGILYSMGGHAEVVTHAAGHEAMNLVSLFLLLVGGSLTGTYLLPASNIAPVISRFLPSSQFFMPTVILFIGFVFGLFNPVIGIMVTLTLLDYEYANTPNSVRVSAAFVANAAAAASPISDVGYILTGAGITTNTWAFSLLFTAVMGVYIGILNPKTSSRSDKFSEKLNWGAISMFIAMIVITLFTMKSYGLVIGMSFAIIASAIVADNKDFGRNLASYAKNFAFLPILVLCWSIEAHNMGSIIGDKIPESSYWAFFWGSAVLDNCALTAGILTIQGLYWSAMKANLCVGGSFFTFSSAVSAATKERYNMAIPVWLNGAIVPTIVYFILYFLLFSL